MKDSKTQYLIKTVYAYIDLVYRLFPFLAFFFFTPLLINILIFHKLEYKSLDILQVFKPLQDLPNLKSISYIFPFLILVSNFTLLVVIFFCLRRLREFIKNVFEGNPFCSENGKHLKFIGIVVSIIVFILHFGNTVFALSIMTEGISLSTFTNFLIALMGILSVVLNPYLFLGLLVVILGEVMIHGAKLKEEIDLTL